jgi:biopolymer transport protein ExbD
MSESFETSSAEPLFGAEEESTSVRVPLAPMIDIVFLLVGFFMLTAQIVGDERDLTVDLPEVNHRHQSDESPGDLVINLRTSGEITVGGDVVSRLDLPDIILSRVEAAISVGERPSIVIRADKSQSFKALDEILGVCEDVGVTPVVLRALPPPGSAP